MCRGGDLGEALRRGVGGEERWEGGRELEEEEGGGGSAGLGGEGEERV